MGPVDPLAISAALGEHIARQALDAAEGGAGASARMSPAQVRVDGSSAYYVWPRVEGLGEVAKRFAISRGADALDLTLDPLSGGGQETAAPGSRILTAPPRPGQSQQQGVGKAPESTSPQQPAGTESNREKKRRRRGQRGGTASHPTVQADRPVEPPSEEPSAQRRRLDGTAADVAGGEPAGTAAADSEDTQAPTVVRPRGGTPLPSVILIPTEAEMHRLPPRRGLSCGAWRARREVSSAPSAARALQP